ncbi:hypothetical protein ACLOJK_013826 [Asimina triloba]
MIFLRLFPNVPFVQANPPQLHSNLLYIQRYRRQSRLVSEAEYFFTNILSAESFIWNIDARSLSMDDAEYENNMRSAQAVLSGLSTGLETFSTQGAGYTSSLESRDPRTLSSRVKKEINTSLPATTRHPQPIPATMKSTEKKEAVSMGRPSSIRPSILDLEKKGAADLLEEDEAGSSLTDYPFLFARVGNLTIGDVEVLLSSYKQIVLKYVSLCKALGSSDLTVHMPVSQTKISNKKESAEPTALQIGNEKTESTATVQGKTEPATIMHSGEETIEAAATMQFVHEKTEAAAAMQLGNKKVETMTTDDFSGGGTFAISSEPKSPPNEQIKHSDSE